MIRSDQLVQLNKELFTELNPGPVVTAKRANSAEKAEADDLVFASKKDQLEAALHGEPAILVVDAKLTLPEPLPSTTRFFKTPHVGMAMATLLPHFDRKLERFEPGIHPQSSIHPSAQLGKNVSVGPFAVVGARAVIGDGVRIGANTVIEIGARIGANTILHPQAFVGAGCILGESCEIHPHTTIGSDGFSFTQDRARKQLKLPQLGIVVLGDRVEVGANCAFDRAAFFETRIGSGTKFDNLCHVAHNVTIGEDCVFAGGFFVAGSSTIGDRFMCGGNVAVGDHVAVASDVVLAGRSCTATDIPAGGAYGGFPVQPMKDYLKMLSSLPQLVTLRKDVARLLKHLGLEAK